MNLYVMLLFIYVILLCRNTAAEGPKFRILAPPFVCPEEEDSMVTRPDNTVITLQSEVASNIDYQWTVRWVPLVEPTQRMTVLLWRSVRELENKLNGAQIEPNTFIIKNSELLPGIKYTFNVTGTSNQEESTTKNFHIDNVKGDRKLLIEGRSDLFAVMLVGAQKVYTDMMYTVDAQVTSCYEIRDYHFTWTVKSEIGDEIDEQNVKGSRLEIVKYSLKPDLYYNIECKVRKDSTGDTITKASMSVRAVRRNLTVNLNVDTLTITINKPFALATKVNTIEDVNLTWVSTFADETFDTFEVGENGTINFLQGLPLVGTYEICVSASIGGNSEVGSCAKIITVEASLPVLQVAPISRVINEDTFISLAAYATDVEPGCTLTWYFASAECLSRNDSETDSICGESTHGVPISEPITVYSLEETFLNELTDFSNETERLLVTAVLKADDGRARLVADCPENNVGFADINFYLNPKPDVGKLKISPDSGIAMETIFRISTLASTDPDRPLKYNFYCNIGMNESILLGSQLEYLSVETFLPYKDGGITLWVEVCDSLGACSTGNHITVNIDPGQARTVKDLIQDAHAHFKRCEKMLFQKLVVFCIATYTNEHQMEALTLFTDAVRKLLDNADSYCKEMRDQVFMQFLENYGVLNDVTV